MILPLSAKKLRVVIIAAFPETDTPISSSSDHVVSGGGEGVGKPSEKSPLAFLGLILGEPTRKINKISHWKGCYEIAQFLVNTNYVPLICLKCLEKRQNILPNGGLMVIYSIWLVLNMCPAKPQPFARDLVGK